MTPPPPAPFLAQQFVIAAGTILFRVASNTRSADEFNPGHGKGSRFAFFGDPTVPVMYLASTMEAAICETLLHDVPVTGGQLRPRTYTDKFGAQIIVQRDLRVASFMGTGLLALQVSANQLTDTDPTDYWQTVKWAEAAHDAGFDGVVWMSRRCNSDQAFVLFGDRLGGSDLIVSPDSGRIFAAGPDLDWLIQFCAPLHIDVLVHS